MRTCTGCREVTAQAALVRLSFVSEGDHAGGRASPGAEALVTGRGPGRGAYVHARPACVEAAARGGLARSFRRAIPAQMVRGLVLTAPPSGGAAGRAQVPAGDPTAPPSGGAAGRAQVPAGDDMSPTVDNLAVPASPTAKSRLASWTEKL